MRTFLRPPCPSLHHEDSSSRSSPLPPGAALRTASPSTRPKVMGTPAARVSHACDSASHRASSAASSCRLSGKAIDASTPPLPPLRSIMPPPAEPRRASGGAAVAAAAAPAPARFDGCGADGFSSARAAAAAPAPTRFDGCPASIIAFSSRSSSASGMFVYGLPAPVGASSGDASCRELIGGGGESDLRLAVLPPPLLVAASEDADASTMEASSIMTGESTGELPRVRPPPMIEAARRLAATRDEFEVSAEFQV